MFGGANSHWAIIGPYIMLLIYLRGVFDHVSIMTEVRHKWHVCIEVKLSCLWQWRPKSSRCMFRTAITARISLTYIRSVTSEKLEQAYVDSFTLSSVAISCIFFITKNRMPLLAQTLRCKSILDLPHFIKCKPFSFKSCMSVSKLLNYLRNETTDL